MSDKNSFVTKNTIIPPNSDVSYPTKKIHLSLPHHPERDNLNYFCEIKVTRVDYVWYIHVKIGSKISFYELL